MPAVAKAGQGALMSMYKSLGRAGWKGSAIAGAVVGGAMGAMSKDPDSSMLGGALKGAIVGAAAYGLGRRGLQGAMTYNRLRKAGMGAGKALFESAAMQGRITGKFFGLGSKKTTALNPIQGLHTAGGAPGTAGVMLAGRGRTSVDPSVIRARGLQMNNARQMSLPGVSMGENLGSVTSAKQMPLNLSGSPAASSARPMRQASLEARMRIDRMQGNRRAARWAARNDQSARSAANYNKYRQDAGDTNRGHQLGLF